MPLSPGRNRKGSRETRGAVHKLNTTTLATEQETCFQNSGSAMGFPGQKKAPGNTIRGPFPPSSHRDMFEGSSAAEKTEPPRRPVLRGACEGDFLFKPG